MPWFLNFLVLSVAHRGGKEISALDNTFALIDEYICADLSSRPNFPLQSCGGPYICRKYTFPISPLGRVDGMIFS